MCCGKCKNLPWGRIVGATLLFAVVDTVLRQAEAFATMKYYLMPEYFSVWSTIMMPKAGPPEAPFYIAAFVGSLLGGLVLALAYYLLKEHHLTGNIWQRALQFTVKMNILLAVFSYYPMWLMIRLPLCLICCWFVTGIIITFIGGLIFGKILK